MTGKKRTDIDNDELVRLYVNEKWAMKKVARHFKCSPATVYDRLQKMGVEKRPSKFNGTRGIGSRGSTRYDEIERMWNQNMTLKEIAHALNTTRNTVSVSLARMRAVGGWNVPQRYATKRVGGKIIRISSKKDTASK